MKEFFSPRLKLIAVFLCILIPFFADAQIEGNSVDWNLIDNVSGRQAMSPQAIAIERYGSYPVQKATGIPEISLPIYTIKSGSLEFPISLSYHMGGIRVEDIPSWVGLGWMLNANGIINRTVRSLADERNDHGWLTHQTWPFSRMDYSRNIPLPGMADATMFYFTVLVDDNRYDQASDIYRYSINGISGKFVYDFDRQLVQIPQTDNKIQRYANDFTIVDNKGNQYKFLERDAERSQNVTQFNSRPAPVSWQISEIISADNADTLRFSYYPAETYTQYEMSKSLIRGLPYRIGSYGEPMGTSVPVGQLNVNNSTTTSTEILLKSIHFRGGAIEFLRDSRMDMRKHCLSQIIIKDSQGIRIKKIQFLYDYFNSKMPATKNEHRRLKLTQLNIYGGDDNSVRKFKFSYNERTILPSYAKTSPISCAQDYWGYYNGATSNKSLLLTEYAISDRADREPREYGMAACVLERIDYPTGGYTIFEPEANRIIKNGKEKITGGLRIAKIKSYVDSNDNSPMIMSYSYENGELIYFPEPEQYKINMAFWYGIMPQSDTFFNNDPDYPNAPATLYMEYPASPMGYYQGASIIYGKVTEMQGYPDPNSPSQLITEGKTVYTYNTPRLNYNSLTSNELSDFIMTAAAPIEWQNGLLLKVEKYAIDTTGTEQKIREIENEYELDKVPQIVYTGTSISNRVIYQKLVSRDDIATDKYTVATHYNHYWTTEATGYCRLIKTTEKDLQDTGSAGTIAVYKYDNTNASGPQKNMLISAIHRYDLHNNLLDRTEYVYAHQQATAYSDMNRKNMLAYPYEERIYSDNNKLVSQRNVDYSTFNIRGYSIIKPSKIRKSYSMSTNSRTEIEYLSYDRWGNPLEIIDKSGLHSVYLWGYCGQYLIAEIKNATYLQIASILGSNTIEQNSNSIKPSSDYFSMVNQLRNNEQIKKALITTYEYKPFYGMIKSTDPSGRDMLYEYDSWGALFKIKDEIKYTLQEFYYNYKN